ncbi:hypothetical protein ACPPVQ_04470 [Diaminobutyricibacter sp. McL0618]|uniref:hypothetical protein n=1 Tax=Leifsonia sp. McL0618 TaxID=3415677 RepID=UPI003CF0062E
MTRALDTDNQDAPTPVGRRSQTRFSAMIGTTVVTLVATLVAATLVGYGTGWLELTAPRFLYRPFAELPAG